MEGGKSGGCNTDRLVQSDGQTDRHRGRERGKKEREREREGGE